jgi:hypothetical protein
MSENIIISKIKDNEIDSLIDFLDTICGVSYRVVESNSDGYSILVTGIFDGDAKIKIYKYVYQRNIHNALFM